MRYSRAFIPTQKETPKDATLPSHTLLLRAGYLRAVGAGLYELLPLGVRVLRRITEIVRTEMDRAGAQEVSMPALLPREYFEETGRWDTFGETLFRLNDRKGSDYHLGPTHEEIVTDMVRRVVKSYRHLPLNLYQIQMKYRDEPRPRGGLLRCREFLMKDAYSFDASENAAMQSYEQMREAYHRIFRRLGLDYRVVRADSGAMGGSTSAEFQVLAQTGEDALVACTGCEYAANLEVAEARTPTPPGHAEDPKPVESIATPGQGGIEDVVRFLGGAVQPSQMLKCLLYEGSGQCVLAVVRGDHEVNEVKLARHLGVADVRLASEQAVVEATGAAVGFAGPVGFAGNVVVDPSAAAVRNAVTGANETDCHLTNVNFGRDYQGVEADIRLVAGGEPCPRCGAPLKAYRGIEGGHIFVLGTRYSDAMGATYFDEGGTERSIVMGCYGIGLSRLIAAAVEQHHDEHGIIWPANLAPFGVVITPIGRGSDVTEAAERLHAEFGEAGLEPLLDDRDERPGVKFKDADLLGMPVRVTVGSRGLGEGTVEVRRRRDGHTVSVPLEDALKTCQGELDERSHG